MIHKVCNCSKCGDEIFTKWTDDGTKRLSRLLTERGRPVCGRCDELECEHHRGNHVRSDVHRAGRPVFEDDNPWQGLATRILEENR